MTLTWKHLAAICFTGAALVAATGHDGWGWLLLIGFVVLL